MFTNLSGSKIVWPITVESRSQIVVKSKWQQRSNFKLTQPFSFCLRNSLDEERDTRTMNSQKHNAIKSELQVQNIKELYLQYVCYKFQ